MKQQAQHSCPCWVLFWAFYFLFHFFPSEPIPQICRSPVPTVNPLMHVSILSSFSLFHPSSLLIDPPPVFFHSIKLSCALTSSSFFEQFPYFHTVEWSPLRLIFNSNKKYNKSPWQQEITLHNHLLFDTVDPLNPLNDKTLTDPHASFFFFLPVSTLFSP